MQAIAKIWPTNQLDRSIIGFRRVIVGTSRAKVSDESIVDELQSCRCSCLRVASVCCYQIMVLQIAIARVCVNFTLCVKVTACTKHTCDYVVCHKPKTTSDLLQISNAKIFWNIWYPFWQYDKASV